MHPIPDDDEEPIIDKPQFPGESEESADNMHDIRVDYRHNIIHPTAIVEASVKLGHHNYIGPYCVLTGNTQIGDNNTFTGHCSVGSAAEHRAYFTKEGALRIGNNNMIREFVTINVGTHSATMLDDDIIMLRGAHVGHDCWIQHQVTLSCNVLVGGESVVMRGANLGLGAIVHQHSVIGYHAMVGMGAVVTKKTPISPCNTYVGNPARYLKRNEYAIKKYGLTLEDIALMNKSYDAMPKPNL